MRKEDIEISGSAYRTYALLFIGTMFGVVLFIISLFAILELVMK